MQPLPLTTFTVALVGILGGGTYWVSHPGLDIERKLHELEAKAVEAEHAVESKVHDFIFGADMDGAAESTKRKRMKLMLVGGAAAIIMLVSVAALLAWGPKIMICPTRSSSHLDITILEIDGVPPVDKVYVDLEVGGHHQTTNIAAVSGGCVKTAFKPVSCKASLDKTMPAGKTWLNITLKQDEGFMHRVQENIGMSDHPDLGHVAIDLKDVAKGLENNPEYNAAVTLTDSTPTAPKRKPVKLTYRCMYKK